MVNRSAVPPSLKRVAHAGSRTFGQLTAAHRMTPSFLIAGGQRCGTTSMHRALAQHPAILKAVLHKGVHYFDTDYDRGMAWYRGHFPLQRTARAIGEREGCRGDHLRVQPVLHVPPAGRGADRRRSAGRENHCPGTRSGGTRLFPACPRGRPRLRDREGLRPRARPGSSNAFSVRTTGWPANRATTATRTSTTRTGLVANTSATWSGWNRLFGRERDPRGGQRIRSSPSPSPSTPAFWTSSACRRAVTRYSSSTTRARARRRCRRVPAASSPSTSHHMTIS